MIESSAGAGMWQHYRKTLPFVQAFILIVCMVLFFYKAVPIAGVVVLFVMMQIGSLLGAFWAARLKRRMSPGTLPLQGRL
jgi:hypothetical protein